MDAEAERIAAGLLLLLTAGCMKADVDVRRPDGSCLRIYQEGIFRSIENVAESECRAPPSDKRTILQREASDGQ